MKFVSSPMQKEEAEEEKKEGEEERENNEKGREYGGGKGSKSYKNFKTWKGKIKAVMIHRQFNKV